MGRILVADAGSSKIDWCSINTNLEYHTSPGWNPSQDQAKLEIDQLPQNLLAEAERIFFYGTGIGTEHSKNRAIKELSTYSNARLHVESDLMGAAKALFGDEHGIVVIIGTGSNVCYYDQGKISFATPSLGYFLSDEGSGNAIGRRIVKDFMYNKMPVDINAKFKEAFELNKTILLDALYQKPRPNVYLSQFSKFLMTVDGAWKESVLQQCFEQLVSDKILAHKNFLSVPIGFVGSIAEIFKDQLDKACKNYDIENIKIIGSPIESLARYHKRNIDE